jgi:hypothetical protein
MENIKRDYGRYKALLVQAKVNNNHQGQIT